MRGTGLTAIAWLTLAASTAAGDSLYVNGRADSLSPGGSGGGGGLEWQHALPGARRLRLGGSAFTLPGARWSSAVAGLAAPAGRTHWTLDATLGHSTLDGTYRVTRGGGLAILDRRLSVAAALQRLGGRSTRGTLGEGSVVAQPSAAVTVQASYFQSLAGSLDTRLGAVKTVVVSGGRRYLAGAAIGRTSPTVLGVRDDTRTQDVRQLFAGVALPLGRRGDELLVTVEHYDLDAARRVLVSVGWKRALR
jgi:hypothetical protein